MDVKAIQYSGMSRYDKFVSFIRKFGTEDALIYIGTHSLKHLKQTNRVAVDPSEIIGRREVTSFLALTLILHSNDFKRDPLNPEILKFIGGLYYNVLGDPFAITTSDIPSNEEFIQALLRIHNEQIAEEGLFGRLLGRTLVMFLDFDDKREFELRSEFFKIHNVSIEDFIFIGYILFILSFNSELGYLDKDFIQNPPKFISQDTLFRFLNSIAANYEVFRNHYKEKPLKNGYEKFEFNFLRKYPLVITEKNQHIILPIPIFFYERFVKGVFHELRERFNKGGKVNEFSSFFGKEIFERYVGYLLSQIFRSDQLIKEIQYGSSDTRTSDWIVVDHDDVILVECKTSCLTLQTKTYAEQNDLLKDLSKIADAIKSATRTINDISNGSILALNHLKGKRFHILVLYFENTSLTNDGIIREQIELKLKERGIEETVQYHILSINEFETLLNCVPTMGLSNLIKLKENDSEQLKWDFNGFLQDHIKNIPVEKLVIDRLLSDRVNNFTKEMMSRNFNQ